MTRHPDIPADRQSFEHDIGYHYTRVPNSNWKIGDGLSPAPEGADKEVYDLFARSKTIEGQKSLFTTVQPSELSVSDNYKLIIGGLIPRPIGFVSTIGADGSKNLSPFSYCAPAGHKPPMIMLAFTTSARKDTCDNIKASKELCVSIVSEPYVEAANYSAIDLPADMSEWAVSGLTQAPSKMIKPPRVAESAYSMECVLEHFYDIEDSENPGQVGGTVVIARVKLFHFRTDIRLPNGQLDPARFLPVSRLGNISYGRTTQAFQIPRPHYDHDKELPEFKRAQEVGDKVVC